MHSFTCFIVITVLATITTAASVGPQGAQNIVQTLTDEVSLNPIPSELTRWKKSAYGGSVPSAPCPKNYLFSCQPHVAPVPCAQQSYAGAYSAPVPIYALPQLHRGIPQELIRPTRQLHQYYY